MLWDIFLTGGDVRFNVDLDLQYGFTVKLIFLKRGHF